MANVNLQATNLSVGSAIVLETSSLPGGALRLLAVPAGSSTQSNTAITTVGAGTLTAAALLSGLITRSGPTAAFTDTTDTAALIQAAWAAGVGASFNFTLNNSTAFVETLAAGTGVTLSGNTIIPANSSGSFQMTWTAAGAITITTRDIVANGALPPAKLTTLNATTGSLPAGAITGAAEVTLISSNAVPGAQLVRTAAQMLADIPNGAVGMSWYFRIVNTGAGTLTLTTDAGATVTLSGTMTVPVNTTRTFYAVLNTATTATITATGTGTYS